MTTNGSEHGREVVVLSGVRTAIGKYGGGLKDVPTTRLAGMVLHEAVERAGIEPGDVGHVVFGNVLHTDTRDMYLSRVAAVEGGLPVETPALTLNRLCGSGLQAIVSAAQTIALGDADAAVAGGAECMSRSQYWLPNMRWGQRMNDAAVLDAMVGALTDPFDDCHMGVTAENIAEKWGISRHDQDELAVESHHRAAKATADGYFGSQILPVDVPVRGGTAQFATDEQIRPDASRGGAGQTEAGLCARGHRHAWQRLEHQRRGGGGGADGARRRRAARAEAARAPGRLCARRRGAEVHGHRPGAGRSQSAGPRRPAARRHRPVRGQRGVRRAGAGRHPRPGAADGRHQSERQRHLARPPGRRHRLHPDRQSAVRTASAPAARRALVTMCIGGGQGIAAIFERMD